MEYSFDKESFKNNLKEFLNPINIWDTFVKKSNPENLGEAIMDILLAIIVPLLTWVSLPLTLLMTILLSIKRVPAPSEKIK